MDNLAKLIQSKKNLSRILDGVSAEDLVYITGLPLAEAEEIVKFEKENPISFYRQNSMGEFMCRCGKITW